MAMADIHEAIQLWRFACIKILEIFPRILRHAHRQDKGEKPTRSCTTEHVIFSHSRPSCSSVVSASLREPFDLDEISCKASYSTSMPSFSAIFCNLLMISTSLILEK